ncbi:hypothetical protein [Endozoicomonas sp. SESOKO4]|uniref:hypothetical protein n=1 Tax=Endozoicomonas sp. SESOKO4 TaxID=2828745 RepID=UPI0021484DCD|nr:hypothetical protein [Endozoicomonas sp. SESOKO4]
MNKSLIRNQNRLLTINKKSSVLLLLLVVCIPNWESWADTIELDNNNFNQYLNADHPVEGDYRLISDINLSLIPWEPVGNVSVPFSLNLDGGGHVISGLEVSTSAYKTATGLFGSLNNSIIRRILLKQPKVTGAGFRSPTGALVGELKGSRIEEVVNYDGTIKTKFSNSHAGGLAGSVSDSVIHDSVNTGTVITASSASTGGIAGLADQTSTISNNLNTGAIISGGAGSSPAGGIVGTLKRSAALNNMNVGDVTVSHTESSGGIAGEAAAARVSNNLNTGKMSSTDDPGIVYVKHAGNRGGIVGRASGQTLVSKNLNTGSIFNNYDRTHAGGIAGQVYNATVVQNVNTGTVNTDSWSSYAGGIAGGVEVGSIQDNLNAGAVISKDYDYVGGVSGVADAPVNPVLVYNNVNTGSLEAKRRGYYGTSGAVAKVWMRERIKNNLDTFTKFHRTFGGQEGYNVGVVRVSKNALKSNLTGLSSTLWNAGDASQLPMLKGINTPYRELARINGTKQTNNRFPTVLNEFADPGGSNNATSFNRAVWNGQDGYLPFPKAFSKPQTLLAGVDCTQGGFDCSEEKSIMSAPSTSSVPPSTNPSSYKDLTHSKSSTSSTAYLSDSEPICPSLEGKPLFQVYDPETQRIYVVIKPKSRWKEPRQEIILVRYKGSEPDHGFGWCGIVRYLPVQSRFRNMLVGYQPLAGQVVHETKGSHLDLISTTPSEKTILFRLDVTDRHRSRRGVRIHSDEFPENLQISDTAFHQGAMYLTGTIDNSLFVGRYRQGERMLSRKYPENSGRLDKEQALNLELSPDGEHFYVLGISDEHANHPLFIRQYDSKQLTPSASFGNNGEERINAIDDDIDSVNSQQDVLIKKNHAYVALFNREEGRLSIRRFATDNGQMDSAFIIEDEIDFSSRTPDSFAAVKLMTTKDYLHAIIYNSDGRLSALTYKNQVNIHRFATTFKPAPTKSLRPIFVGNKAYLATENDEIREDGRKTEVRMQEISLGLEFFNHQKAPTALAAAGSASQSASTSASGSAEDTPWGTVAAAGGTAVVVIATIAVYLAIKKFKRQPTVSEMEPNELQPLRNLQTSSIGL